MPKPMLVKAVRTLNTHSTGLQKDLDNGLKAFSLPQLFAASKFWNPIREYKNPEKIEKPIFSTQNRYSEAPHSAFV